MKNIPLITSTQNKQIRIVCKLLNDRKTRKKEGLFVAEGYKVVSTLSLKSAASEVVCAERFFKKHRSEIKFKKMVHGRDTHVSIVRDSIFNTFSSLTTSDGILAVFRQLIFPLDDFTTMKRCVGVLCENIQDPTNIGSIIRTCLCLGADALFLTHDSVDIYNPKVVRASAGYLMHMPVHYISLQEVALLIKKKMSLLVSDIKDTEKSKALSEIGAIPSRIMIAFGNEGRGISRELYSIGNNYFYIPMDNEGESLNINAAVAITLFSIVPKVKTLFKVKGENCAKKNYL